MDSGQHQAPLPTQEGPRAGGRHWAIQGCAVGSSTLGPAWLTEVCRRNRGLVGECPPARVAHERLLSLCDPVVALEGVALRELLAALVTAVAGRSPLRKGWREGEGRGCLLLCGSTWHPAPTPTTAGPQEHTPRHKVPGAGLYPQLVQWLQAAHLLFLVTPDHAHVWCPKKTCTPSPLVLI